MADDSMGIPPSAGRGSLLVPPNPTSTTGKLRSQARQNAEAVALPPGVTSDQNRECFQHVMGGLSALTPAQLVQVESCIKAQLVPAGLSVTIARRRAISDLSGHGPSSSGGPSNRAPKAKAKPGEKRVVFDPLLMPQIQACGAVAKATAELTESFQRPLEGSKEAPSQSLKKDWRNLSMDDFRQRHGEGAALNRHLSIGVLRSRIHHGKLKAQELLKAEKDSGTKHSQKELDDIIEKEMASVTEPFFIGKKTKETKDSKERQAKRPLESPKDTGPARKSVSKSPARVESAKGTPQIEEMEQDPAL